MRNKAIILALVCGVAGAGCHRWSPDPVTSVSSPTANFTRFRTFAVATPRSVVHESFAGDVESILEDVNRATELELQQRGLREVGLHDNPDLVAFSLVATGDNTAVSWDCTSWHWYGRWDWDWTPCSSLPSRYTEGTVFLGVADPQRKQVVFAGTIRGVNGSEIVLRDRIHQDVIGIFVHYPKRAQRRTTT